MPISGATSWADAAHHGGTTGLRNERSYRAAGSSAPSRKRAANRFAGNEPEFRPGVVPGHIPGSGNLPYAEIVDAKAGTFVSSSDLRNAFDAQGATGMQTVVTTCGSGITACILGLGMHLIGRDDWAIYDGSWTEWGGSDDTPKEPKA